MSIAVSQANLGHQAGHQVSNHMLSARACDPPRRDSRHLQVLTPAQRLAGVNEETWLQVGENSPVRPVAGQGVPRRSAETTIQESWRR